MRSANFFILFVFLAASVNVFSQPKSKKDDGKNLKKDEMLLTYTGSKKFAKGENSEIAFTNDKNEKVIFAWVDKSKPEVMKMFFSQFPTEDDDGNYDMTVKENAGKKYRIKWQKVKLPAEKGTKPEEFNVIEGAAEVSP